MHYFFYGTLVNAVCRMPPELNCVDKANKKLVATAMSLEGSKSSDRSSIYSRNSTKPENLAKMGPVDFEITGLRETVKKIKQTNK